jgi:hypothetical protein
VVLAGEDGGPSGTVRLCRRYNVVGGSGPGRPNTDGVVVNPLLRLLDGYGAWLDPPSGVVAAPRWRALAGASSQSLSGSAADAAVSVKPSGWALRNWRPLCAAAPLVGYALPSLNDHCAR